MTPRTRSTLLIAATAIALSQLGATDCGGNVLTDPGFDLWCGRDLCSWRLESGDIAKVPSWHAGDDAVELLGTNAAIYQMSPVHSVDGTCIRFSMIANVEPDTEVRLQLDAFADGILDHDLRVPTSDWTPVSFTLRMPDKYQGIRFRLIKVGRGRAVFAQIEAITVESGCGPATIALSRPDGAWCDVDEECASGRCLDDDGLLSLGRICGGCVTDADCGKGQACGRADNVPGHLAVAPVCGPAGRHGLGERCRGGAECASGICEYETCSECRTDADCGGADCGEGPEPDTGWQPPQQCAPRAGAGAPGAPCLVDADCASATCAGEVLGACEFDHRTCASAVECPVLSAGTPPACVPVGIADGTCE